MKETIRKASLVKRVLLGESEGYPWHACFDLCQVPNRFAFTYAAAYTDAQGQNGSAACAEKA